MLRDPPSQWPDDDVILYDGVCVFCSRWIRFVVARDTAARFRFTAIQSPLRHSGAGFRHRPGRSRHQCGDPWRHCVFQIRRSADGAVKFAGLAMGARAMRGVPKPLRDAAYNLVARNRYRIFGKYEACFVPDAEFRARVME